MRRTILQLLSGKDQTLLIWWDPLLLLNLHLDIVDSVAGLDLKSDGLAGKGLHEAISQTKLLISPFLPVLSYFLHPVVDGGANQGFSDKLTSALLSQGKVDCQHRVPIQYIARIAGRV